MQNINPVCSNILLNSASSTLDVDTLIQLMIENKAYYLEIKAGLLQYFRHFLYDIIIPIMQK